MGSKIDNLILVFVLYHMIRGYMRGLSGSLFLSLRFSLSIGLSSYILGKYSERMMKLEPVRVYIKAAGKFLQTFLSPFIYEALQIEMKILWLSLLILLSLLLGLLFELFRESLRKNSLQKADKHAGFFFGALKAVLYLMLIVALADSPMQRLAVVEIQDMLSVSRLLKYLYSYNIFLDYFS